MFVCFVLFFGKVTYMVCLFVCMFFKFDQLFSFGKYSGIRRSRWRSSSSPAPCTTEPGFVPRSQRSMCIWFPDHACFCRFFSRFSSFPTASKTVFFVNKSISGNIVWSYRASANWQVILHYTAMPLHSLGNTSCVMKVKFIFDYL